MTRPGARFHAVGSRPGRCPLSRTRAPRHARRDLVNSRNWRHKTCPLAAGSVMRQPRPPAVAGLDYRPQKYEGLRWCGQAFADRRTPARCLDRRSSRASRRLRSPHVKSCRWGARNETVPQRRMPCCRTRLPQRRRPHRCGERSRFDIGLVFQPSLFASRTTEGRGQCCCSWRRGHGLLGASCINYFIRFQTSERGFPFVRVPVWVNVSPSNFTVNC